MQDSKNASRLKVLFLEITSTELILIGYVISNGEYNPISAFLLYAGFALFLISCLMGVFVFLKKEN